MRSHPLPEFCLNSTVPDRSGWPHPCLPAAGVNHESYRPSLNLRSPCFIKAFTFPVRACCCVYHRIAWLLSQACCQTPGATCHGIRLYPLHRNVTKEKRRKEKKMFLSHVVFGVTSFIRTAIASILPKPWPRCPAAHVVGSFTEVYHQDVTLLCIATEARCEYSHVHTATGTYTSAGSVFSANSCARLLHRYIRQSCICSSASFTAGNLLSMEQHTALICSPLSNRGRTIEASLLCHCAFRAS